VQINNVSAANNSVINQGSNLGKQDFLRLLVTQLNNQNPLDVQQNTEFVAQLAQFANLESLDNLNNKFSMLVSNKITENQLNAANLVGKQVKVISNNAYLDDKSQHITGSINSPENSIKLQIYDANGRQVREIILTNKTDGQFQFNWDGLDDKGNQLSNGKYTFITDNPANQVYLDTKISTVELTPTGKIILNTENLGKIAFEQIKNIGV